MDRSIPLPCSNPTAPCFGGPDLRTIFVTSLRHDLPAEVLADKPLSGGIFAVRVDVPGVPVARFARLTTTRERSRASGRTSAWSGTG